MRYVPVSESEIREWINELHAIRTETPSGAFTRATRLRDQLSVLLREEKLNSQTRFQNMPKKTVGALGKRTVTKTGMKAKPAKLSKKSGGKSGGRKGSR